MPGDGLWSWTGDQQALHRAREMLRHGDVERAFGLVHELAHAAGRSADRAQRVEVHAVEAEMLLALGRTDEVLARALPVLGTDGADAEGLAAHALLRAAVAEAALEHGDVGLAGRLVEDRDGPHPAGSGKLVEIRARCALVSGRAAEVWPATISASCPPGADPLSWLGVLVEGLLWARQPRQAVLLVERALASTDPSADPLQACRFASVGMRACADLREQAEAGADVGDLHLTSRTDRALRRLIDDGNLAEVVLYSQRSTRSAEQADWFAESARMNGYARTSSWWRTAAGRWQEHGRPHREAYARWRLARALESEGDRDGCGEHLRRALVVGATHQPVAAAVRGTAAALHIRLEPDPQPQDTAGRGGATRSSGEDRQGTVALAALTPREREVMDLIAAGLTAASAARRLDISPRTVGKHLENVYGKLGADNRVSALRRLRGEADPGTPS